MQFRLRTLFGCITALGVYFAVVFALPFAASYVCLMLMSFFMIPVMVTGVVYERGYARTFWIGCAASGVIPLLAMLYFSAAGLYLLYDANGDDESRAISILLAVSHALVLLSGGVAVVSRWLIERNHHALRSDATGDMSILHGRVTVAELRRFETENE